MRAVGVKLEVRLPKAVSDLLDSLVGTIYGQSRADVARFLLQRATDEHYTELVQQRDLKAQREAAAR